MKKNKNNRKRQLLREEALAIAKEIIRNDEKNRVNKAIQSAAKALNIYLHVITDMEKNASRVQKRKVNYKFLNHAAKVAVIKCFGNIPGFDTSKVIVHFRENKDVITARIGIPKTDDNEDNSPWL